MVNITKWETGQAGKLPIIAPEIFQINVPAAGNYPQGLYRYPFRVNSQARERFTQTLTWLPPVPKTFAANTQYTAVLTLGPAGEGSFRGIKQNDVSGLPERGAESVSAEIKGESLVIQIVYEKTAGEKAPAKIIFGDEFDGDSLDKTKWDLCPEWDRQGRSSWRDEMVSVGGGCLHLKIKRDAALGAEKAANDKALAGNWIIAGGIRSRKKDNSPIFDNGYGWYEARIKFPLASGTWGAFWLMSPTQKTDADDGADGTEIDIVESINNEKGRYNSALHWKGYGEHHKGTGSGDGALPADIYDGKFHTFALDWSPSEYVFYVDGIEYWRVDGSEKFSSSGINQNLNYVKLTTEGAGWAGPLPENFSEDEMLVDYVRVYSQPQII